MRDKDSRAAAAFLAVAGGLSAKFTETALGKTLRVDMNVRHQDDLPSWDALPPEVRAKLEQVLDSLPTRVIQGEATRVPMLGKGDE